MVIKVRLRRRDTLSEDSESRVLGPVRHFPPAPRRLNIFPYLASTALHAFCILLSVMIAGLFPQDEGTMVEYRSKALIIRLPQLENISKPLPENVAQRAEDRDKALKEMADQLVVALREGKEPARQQPPASPDTDLEVPKPPVKTEAVLIQPQFPLDMQPPPMSPTVPSVLLWPAQLPAVPPEQVVVSAPGPQEVTVPNVPQPVPAVRPSLRKVVVPDAFRPNTIVSNAELSAPPPIGQGQAIALLSISDAPMVRDMIVVLPGNIIPSAAPAKSEVTAANRTDGSGAVSDPPGNGGTPHLTSASAPIRANQSRTTSDRTSPENTVSKGKTPNKAPPGNSTSPPLPPAEPGVRSAAMNEKPSLSSVPLVAGKAGVIVDRKAAGSPVANVPPAVILEPAVNAIPPGRLDHPANGLFDVVIVQTTLDESVTGSGNLLHGRPIYTVYLQVGDTKDWILHYCVKDGSVVQRGAVFQLPDPRPVKAPYPRVTYRPAGAVTGSDAYVLVHGLIDASGLLQDLKVIGGLKTGEASLLAALGQWRFRPAMRADEPEPVEMVLAIPIGKS